MFGAVICVAAATLLVDAQAPDKSLVEKLVLVHKGTMPIILSAPHGGLDGIPGVSERKGDGLVKGPSGFFTGRDTNTDRLALDIADALEAKMGKKPYVVIAKFHRKYIDANRPEGVGLESPKAKPIYEGYHRALRDACKEVQRKWGRGLLLDVHGQGSAADTIFRGTKNGTTVKLLVDRFGEKAHNGPRSFFGLLETAGLKGFPLDGSKERSGFTGGYIVQSYGSHTGYGIDAIQLEFGGDFRAMDKTKDTAVKLANAVDAYAKLYLSEPAPAEGKVVP
jgi:N-formylglutamate amidohydrolase